MISFTLQAIQADFLREMELECNLMERASCSRRNSESYRVYKVMS